MSPDRVVALVPAHDEGDRVGATVRSLASLPEVSEVIVVDDGSLDGTAAVALAAGATVLRIPHRLGKGGALEGALRRLPPADIWLLADADLGETAGRLAPVLAAVVEDRADLAVALVPPQAGGGLGSVRRFAARAIALLSGFEAEQPLSGQRAVRRRRPRALPAARRRVRTRDRHDDRRGPRRPARARGPRARPRASGDRPGPRRVRPPGPAGSRHPARGGGADRPPAAPAVRLPEQLYAENFRGRRIPRILGIVLAAWAALGMAVLVPAAGDASESWSVFGAALLVFAAGLVDDLAPIGPRGLRGHLRALLSGRMTTGILKVLVTAGAAVVVVALLDRGDAVTRLGGRDADRRHDQRLERARRPAGPGPEGVHRADGRGRARRCGAAPAGPIGAAVLSGAVLVLLPDLREWAMLGDAGANLLGFTAGVVLAGALPTWATWPAAAVAVALNVVAETVTFSRVIDAVAPLRWFDRLGTRP